MAKDVLFEIEGLKTYFSEKRDLFNWNPGTVKAVDDVSFTIFKGETLGIVGESGCGKSTLARTLLRLIDATAGSVVYEGQNLFQMDRRTMWKLRQALQIIFQDPYSSLNPKMTVEHLVREPLDVYGIDTPEGRRTRVIETLREVGLDAVHLKRFPHEFSGGQRQRIMIARALVMSPEFVVCDEPVSALDVSVRAQVLNLMAALKRDRRLTYLFISHDLSVVKHVCDRIAVMYLGQIVEMGTKDAVFKSALHPYTSSLLEAIPVPNPEHARRRKPLQGDVPSAYNPPKGCRFHTRCPYQQARCIEEMPELRDISAPSASTHSVRCHFAEALIGELYSPMP